MAMLFSSYAFILVFLPLFLLFWQGCAVFYPKALPLYLLGVSLLFYGLWGLSFLVLLILIISLNWFLGLLVCSWPDKWRTLSRKALFIIALGLNLAPLLWFKYSWFAISNLGLLFGVSWEFSPPGLPLGISFYTFIQIAWLYAVYKNELKPGGLLRHLLFSACFLYVMSGPIVRGSQVLPQYDELRGISVGWLARGLTLFVIGLSKKVILADSIAVYANAVFGAAEKGWQISTPEAWLGSICYTFQLYFDFSGYTDMALGLGLMIGLNLPQNFDSPYKATGIADFWRRWHITLSLWLRDFLYIPLGGNRKGRVRQYVNLFLTMLIGGAWHGAGWTYIIWGAMHGLMLSVNHFFRALIKGTAFEGWGNFLPLRLLSTGFTFFCLNFCWVIFRAPNPESALAVYRPMFRLVTVPDYWPPDQAEGLTRFFSTWLPNGYFDLNGLLLTATCFLLVWGMPNSGQIMAGGGRLFGWRPARGWATGMAFALFACLALLGRKTTFLYFQF